MQAEFVKVICRMGIFMICAQAIVHFRPKASYEKYLKMLVSMMLVLQMFLLVGGVFQMDGEQLFRAWEGGAGLFHKEELGMEILGLDPQSYEESGGEVTVPEIRIQIAPVEPIHIGTE